MKIKKKKALEKYIIEAHDKERANLLISRGVSGQDIVPSKLQFDLFEFLVRMEIAVPGTSSKTISVGKQVRNFSYLLEHPLRGSYTLGISSYPSDLRAKFCAQHLMSAAISYYLANRKKFGARSMPLWHNVYGSYKDSLRDHPRSESPVMLIIGNLHDEASSTKIEKTRDLLEMYSDIPRIVVSGGQPTCDLFAYRLAYPMKSGLYIGPANLVREAL